MIGVLLELLGILLKMKFLIIYRYKKKGALDEIQLTDSLSSQINKMPFYGLQFSGERFDCGTKSGFIKANISVALKDPEIGFDVSNWIKSIL